MSDRSITTSAVQTTNSNPEAIPLALAALPWWQAASEEQRRLIVADAEEHTGKGLALADYAAGLPDHANAAAYIVDVKLGIEQPAEQPLAEESAEYAKITAAQVRAAFSKGQKGLTKWCLESGRLAYGFVYHRVRVLKHERAAAVKAIGGQLCDEAGKDVDVNGLIATYQAARLLDEGDQRHGVPWSTLEAYCPLVQRDSGTEEWMIVAGIEAEARALFAEASSTTPTMPLASVQKRVRELDAQAKALRAAELAKQAADPKAGKAARDAAAKAQVQADKAASKVAQQGTEKPAPATERPAVQEPEECRAPVCRLSCRIGETWIEKADVGGASGQPDPGDRRKAAFSDALKRAAVKFGIGRYLYSLAPVWKDFDPRTKRFVTAPPAPKQTTSVDRNGYPARR